MPVAQIIASWETEGVRGALFSNVSLAAALCFAISSRFGAMSGRPSNRAAILSATWMRIFASSVTFIVRPASVRGRWIAKA